ncbi:MAG: DUF4249 domain-containing protein [Allomuricauda sp.]
MKQFFGVKYLVVSVTMLLLGCTDPVEPEYSYVEGLMYIDAQISTSVGTSYAKIYESNTDFRLYRNIFQPGATVVFRNVDTNGAITLSEGEDVYVPPEDFRATNGETWQLEITLEDGRQYRSQPETVNAPIPFQAINAEYRKELLYREDVEEFVPGHSITISLNDPAETANHYLWGYRSFERPRFCQVCYNSVFRNGECVSSETFNDPYYTYGCETSDCFQIRYHEKIELLSDEFVDGLTVNNLEVAQVPLYTNADILVEVQQFSISPNAYEYYKVLKDIVDNNSGFNAPPPAALIGNLVSLNSDDEFVLGRFTAVASSTQSIFIARGAIVESPIEPILPANYEMVSGPGSATTTAPCTESRYRTAMEPDGWVD